jgi:hypothetical protein
MENFRDKRDMNTDETCRRRNFGRYTRKNFQTAGACVKFVGDYSYLCLNKEIFAVKRQIQKWVA